MAIALIAFSTIRPYTLSAQTTQPATQHLKKDGTIDKRYKGNKSATTAVPATATATPAQPANAHLKADGSVDKRYKENKTAATPASNGAIAAFPDRSPTTHLTKSGAPDKRYKTNKTAAAPSSTSTNPTSAPAASPVRAQATPVQQANPRQLPPTTTAATTRHLKKDGTPDMRYKENRTPGLDKDGSKDKRYKVNKTN